jgi:hypothetical protein
MIFLIIVGCKLVNFSTLSLNRSIYFSFSPFDLIHSDIWGPSLVAIKEGSRYYISFIDSYTRYYWVYLMKYRFEFFEIYTAFRALVKTQYSTIIKCFMCDLGREYTCSKFCKLLALDEIIHQTSRIDTPE